MWKTVCIFVTICWMSSATNIPENKTAFTYVVDLIESLNYYNVVIFVNSKTVSLNRDIYSMIMKLMDRIQSAIVDLADFNYDVLQDSRDFISPRVLRSSSLCLIFQSDGTDYTIESVREVIKFLVKETVPLMIPRCLILSDSNSDVHASFGEVLSEAWLLGFLDFSVVSLNNTNLVQIFHYNPFTKSYETCALMNASSFFPDKLTNLNGYTLKMPVYDLAPYNSFETDEYGNVFNVDGYDYPYIIIISKLMNFSIDCIIINVDRNITELFDIIIFSLEHNIFDLIPKPLYLGTNYHGRNITIGLSFRDTFYLLIGPTIKKSKFAAYMKILITLSYFPISIFFVNIIFRILNYSWIQWAELLKIFFSISLNYQPKKALERVMFLTIVLLSMIISSNIFADLMDANVGSSYETYETREQILASNLPVYSRYTDAKDYNTIFQQYNVQHIDSALTCLRKLSREGNCLCIIPKLVAIYLINNKINQSKPMQMWRLGTHTEKVSFAFANASPYREKFDALIQTLLESGIQASWKYPRIDEEVKTKMREHVEKEAQMDETDSNAVLIQLTVVMIFLYCYTTIVFIVELLKPKIHHENRV